MSEDLKQAFFERDLTDEEEDLLERDLAVSQEAAQIFIGHARAAYLATGLPDPEGGPAAASMGNVIRVLATGTAITGLWLYGQHLLKDTHNLKPEAVIEMPPQLQPARPQTTKARQTTLEPTPIGEVSQESVGRKYGEVEVIVNQKTEGIVTVRVLDEEGREVWLVYAGLLQRGNWSFAWDGRLSDGSKASPGIYSIEAQAGGVVQSRQISIGRE